MDSPEYVDRLWDFQPLSPGAFRVRQVDSEAELFRNRRPGSSDEDPRFVVPGLTRLPGLPTRQQVREIGVRLWNAIPDALRALPVGAAPTRVKISTTAERIVDLPWECLDRDGQPLALDPRVRLVRSVAARYPLPPLTVSLPIRVLLVLTNPKDERFLQAGSEIQTVAPEGRPEYAVEVCAEPTPSGLREQLRTFQPHVVHYIGHSACEAGQGNLILHDDRQHSHWLGATELAAMLPATVRLLCLSTCFTARNYDLRGLIHLAHAPSDVALPSTVVNVSPLDPRGQPAIRAFWEAFYRVLVEDCGDVTSAVHEGRRATAALDTDGAEWASFALVIRDGNGWGLRVQDSPQDAMRKQAELEALFASRLANNLSGQSVTLPPEAQQALFDHSQAAATAAEDALSRFGGFDLPRIKPR
jgi:hypothetical protein